MGIPSLGGCQSVGLSDGVIQTFYTSEAWIDSRAEDQLDHVLTWSGVKKIAVFPDLHLGKYGPVGCAVLAERIYPQLIGNDIGCGMSFFQLNLPHHKLKLDKAARRIRVLGQELARLQTERLEAAGLSASLYPQSLGTIGGGNHFCEIQTLAQCESGCELDPKKLYLLVHSGSRGLGDTIFRKSLASTLEGLSGESEEGKDYIASHDQAVLWASLNRLIIAERAAEALRCELELIADVPHNCLETIAEGYLHRKGAAMAKDLVPVAGSRATPSYLVKPLHHTQALGSLAHGAGRRYDRSSMHGRVGARKSDVEAMRRNSFGGHVICEDRALLIEEAPQAYKSAQSVVSDLQTTGVAHAVATLNPLLTFKKTRAENKR